MLVKAVAAVKADKTKALDMFNSVEFHAECLAGRVLLGPGVCAKQLLCIWVANGNVLTVADIGAKYIQITVQESTLSLAAAIMKLRIMEFLPVRTCGL
jgi:hypothetical protein